MYYNTTNEQGEDLRELMSKAMTQQDRIIELFKANKGTELTPPEVLNEVFTLDTPLTSIRRAITTATNQGFLVQTGNKKMGSYGRSNYCWKYKG